jgi:anti-sigma factor RsiW
MSAASAHLSYELLSRFVDRRIAAIDEAQAQRHLASCERCRSELAWLKRIGRAAPRDEPDRLGGGWATPQST